ncbi:MAG: hypothetical protein J6S67_10020 [Methanobrevibacter sp.]|nr:hypothetical protein [Methanobrevibacter sp.]
MYKVIKENKIIGISEDYPKLLDDYEVVEDIKHTCKDYEQYNGEYILKKDIPIDYQNEQIRQQRQARYVVESDPLRLDYDEALAREQDNAEQLKQEWLSSKDKIREELPYITGERND